MYQEESIYNLLPKKVILPEKERMYRSMYPHWIAPTASTFILKNTSYPNVANMGGEIQYPRGAHPIKGGWRTFGLPNGGYKQQPSNFYKKGHQYKILPPSERVRADNEVRKPPIITVRDKPIMGLKTEKDFVKANAVENIMMHTRKKQVEKETDLDYYLKKKNYGKVPKYINRAKSASIREVNDKAEIYRRNQNYKNSLKKELNQNEVEIIREGLKKKLDSLYAEYGKISHRRRFDTLTTKNYKEELEAKIDEVEHDLEKVTGDKVIVDYTK